MSTGAAPWKRGRGRLGVFEPLLGWWRATSTSPMGPVTCVRSFSRVLGGKYVELRATWEIGTGGYEEIAYFGVDEVGALGFWSFTSDGKQSRGTQCDAAGLHPEAICFEAKMPAGTARTAYSPGESGGVIWVVESKTKKGWNRFVEHHYART